MDLLSPAESQAFKSFLSSIDYTDALPAPEWGMYASGVGEDLHLEEVQGKEALTKATKDLMSLDSGSYSHYTTHNHHYQPQHHNRHPQQFQFGNGGGNGNHHPYNEQRHGQQQQQRYHHHLQQQQQQQTTYASTRHDSFPFLHSSKSSHLHPHQHDQRLSQRHSHSHPSPHIPPLHTLNPPTDMIPSSSSSPSGSSNYSSTTPTSPHPSYARPSSRAQTLHSQLLPAPPSSAPPMQVQIRVASPRAQGKRPSEGFIKPPTSSMSVNGNDAKRRKPSPTSTSTAPEGSASVKMSNKPALLSPSQKKANHIQSEQKRRANIRRGYEALCETVPALREAIREEEMAAGQEKKGKKRKKGKGEKNDEEGKFNSLGIDGRAGPRSENVVLAKTIDYITTLLAERSSLLARLHAARSSLPSGHNVLIPQQEPLWEREWKGGESRLEGEDGDEDEEDEDEE